MHQLVLGRRLMGLFTTQPPRKAKRRNETYPRAANQPQPAGSYQVGPDGTTTYQPTTTGTAEGQAKPPPPDGATSTCRRCSNEIIYSGANGRWEHPGRGHYECFQPHG